MAKEKLIRLRNGAVESEETIGIIMIDLRKLEAERNDAFQALVKLCLKDTALPSPLEKILSDKEFLKADGSPWDDVQDVVESGVERKGRGFVLRPSPLGD